MDVRIHVEIGMRFSDHSAYLLFFGFYDTVSLLLLWFVGYVWFGLFHQSNFSFILSSTLSVSTFFPFSSRVSLPPPYTYPPTYLPYFYFVLSSPPYHPPLPLYPYFTKHYQDPAFKFRQPTVPLQLYYAFILSQKKARRFKCDFPPDRLNAIT